MRRLVLLFGALLALNAAAGWGSGGGLSSKCPHGFVGGGLSGPCVLGPCDAGSPNTLTSSLNLAANPPWIPNANGGPAVPVVTAAAATSPDGGMQAFRVDFDSASGTAYSYLENQTSLTSNAANSCSVWVMGAPFSGTEDFCIYDGATSRCVDCNWSDSPGWHLCVNENIAVTGPTLAFQFGALPSQHAGQARPAQSAYLWGPECNQGNHAVPFQQPCDTGRADAGFLPTSFTLAADYEWPYAGSDRIPACTDDATCVAVCGIGVLTGSATAWECKGHNGLSFGTVTDPGTCTHIDSFIPGVKAIEVVDACAPSVVSATLDAMFGVSTASTIIMGGYGRASGAPLSNNMWLDANGTTGGVQINADNAGLLSGFYKPVLFGNGSNGDTGNEGWTMVSQGRDGSTHYQLSIGTNEYLTTSATAVAAITGTPSYYFGKFHGAGGYELHGPLIFAAFYSTYKTAAQRRVILDKYWGSYTAAGTLGGLSSQYRGIDHTATTGNVDIMYPGTALISDGGLVAQKAYTNYWAVNARAPATWDAVGTPVVTNGTTLNPFSVADGVTTACKLYTVANALALEGAESHTSAGTALGFYNASAYVAAGTAGVVTTKARIEWDTDGTIADAGTGCNFTGLTSAVSRLSCNAKVLGSPTSIKAKLLVGNTVGDVGSIQMCQGQMTVGPGLFLPTPDSTARGNVYYTLAPTTDGWPTTTVTGKYEVVHSPIFDPVTQWYTNLGTYYLFDASQTSHDPAEVFGYTAPGEFLAVFRDGSGNTPYYDLTTNSVGLTVGATYATALEWHILGGGKCNLYVYHNNCGATPAASCHATTIVNGDVTGTAGCPGTPTLATLSNRFDGTVPSSINLKAVRIYTSP